MHTTEEKEIVTRYLLDQVKMGNCAHRHLGRVISISRHIDIETQGEKEIEAIVSAVEQITTVVLLMVRGEHMSVIAEEIDKVALYCYDNLPRFPQELVPFNMKRGIRTYPLIPVDSWGDSQWNRDRIEKLLLDVGTMAHVVNFRETLQNFKQLIDIQVMGFSEDLRDELINLTDRENIEIRLFELEEALRISISSFKPSFSLVKPSVEIRTVHIHYDVDKTGKLGGLTHEGGRAMTRYTHCNFLVSPKADAK